MRCHESVRRVPFCFKQEPSAEERAALRAKRKQVGRPEVEMACWLLEALAKDVEGDYAKGVLYHRHPLGILARCGFILFCVAVMGRCLSRPCCIMHYKQFWQMCDIDTTSCFGF